MAFEIDYLAVGEGERSGDAIALRFHKQEGGASTQKVVVIDGGFQESGEELAAHINDYYGTNRVDVAISTHPDADHTVGLSSVLEKMSVGALVMHRPWEHAADIKNLFRNGKITASGLEKKLEDSLQHASDLEALAQKKGIKIYEPFQGLQGFDGMMHVLGPSQEYYESLLPHFRGTPAPATPLSALGQIRKIGEEAIRWIEDKIHLDLLNDEDSTSAENNTSAIILFQIDGQKFLFTGDAGITALTAAADYVENLGISLVNLNFLDVPHHGSKRNLGSSILKRIKTQTAFISAAKDSDKHPARKITNALQKYGAKVFTTCGRGIYHTSGFVARPNWVPIAPTPFYQLVEE